MGGMEVGRKEGGGGRQNGKLDLPSWWCLAWPGVYRTHHPRTGVPVSPGELPHFWTDTHKNPLKLHNTVGNKKFICQLLWMSKAIMAMQTFSQGPNGLVFISRGIQCHRKAMNPHHQCSSGVEVLVVMEQIENVDNTYVWFILCGVAAAQTFVTAPCRDSRCCCAKQLCSLYSQFLAVTAAPPPNVES